MKPKCVPFTTIPGLNAPAHAQENIYLNVLGKTLRAIDEAKAFREMADELPQNVLRDRHAISTSVLNTLGRAGSVVDDKT